MMEQTLNGNNGPLMNLENVKVEEDEEEFRSCCEDENELREREELVKMVSQANDLDEHSVKMYFKGVSVAGPGESDSGFSGIGVVIERSANISLIQVQKKLQFYVDESVANYLALMDGLIEAKQNKIKKIFDFTDSQILYEQVLHGERLEDPLLIALKQRIAEHTSGLEAFTLGIVPAINLQTAAGLAQVAIGVITLPDGKNNLTQNCSICCDDKLASMMMTLNCSHRFCSHCMKKYVEGKIQSTQVPVRCPQLKCKYYLSAAECKAFLPVISYTSLIRLCPIRDHETKANFSLNSLCYRTHNLPPLSSITSPRLPEPHISGPEPKTPNISAINDIDSKGQWEPLAPTKEAQEFNLSQRYHEGLAKLQAKDYEKIFVAEEPCKHFSSTGFYLL